MDDRPAEILTFWFGPPGADAMARASVWYTRDAAFDEEIRRRFGNDIELAARGEFDAWSEGEDVDAARGTLALVVVLDQFSRNAYRNTARAFANDARALEACLRGHDKGLDRLLTPVERSFLYMPMMHAESRELQRRSVAAFERLAGEVERAGEAVEVVKFLASASEYARRHASVVDRFGRFPGRNVALGRVSTEEEVVFLKNGPGF